MVEVGHFDENLRFAGMCSLLIIAHWFSIQMHFMLCKMVSKIDQGKLYWLWIFWNKTKLSGLQSTSSIIKRFIETQTMFRA